MKYTFNGVFIVAEAENHHDNEVLMNVVKLRDLAPSSTETKRRKHKKHNFRKVCE